MQIVYKHSHLGGEEYLLVHQKKFYQKIVEAINSANEQNLKQKINNIESMKPNIGIHINFDNDSSPLSLFSKSLILYRDSLIDLAIEILPTRRMKEKLSNDVLCYEDGIYAMLRNDRTNPPVPLLIFGVEP